LPALCWRVLRPRPRSPLPTPNRSSACSPRRRLIDGRNDLPCEIRERYGSDLSKIDLTRSNLVDLSHVSEQTTRAALQVAQAPVKRAWEQAHPKPVVTLRDVADHVEHIRQVAGVDHVGLGSEFAGIPEAMQGLDGG
jgi:hypothetical protein